MISGEGRNLFPFDGEGKTYHFVLLVNEEMIYDLIPFLTPISLFGLDGKKMDNSFRMHARFLVLEDGNITIYFRRKNVLQLLEEQGERDKQNKPYQMIGKINFSEKRDICCNLDNILEEVNGLIVSSIFRGTPLGLLEYVSKRIYPISENELKLLPPGNSYVYELIIETSLLNSDTLDNDLQNNALPKYRNWKLLFPYQAVAVENNINILK